MFYYLPYPFLSEAVNEVLRVKGIVGPLLTKAIVLLTFYEKKSNQGFFGLLKNEEKVVQNVIDRNY